MSPGKECIVHVTQRSKFTSMISIHLQSRAPKVQNSLKSVHICKSYCEKITGTFFMYVWKIDTYFNILACANPRIVQNMAVISCTTLFYSSKTYEHFSQDAFTYQQKNPYWYKQRWQRREWNTKHWRIPFLHGWQHLKHKLQLLQALNTWTQPSYLNQPLFWVGQYKILQFLSDYSNINEQKTSHCKKMIWLY